jgi:hypothetical protein
MKELAVISDGHALVEHYEALRKDVVNFDGQTHAVRGLALLMRKGMASWMKGVSERAVPIAAPARPVTDRSLPIGIEQSLVDILATMALATAWEVSRDFRDPFESTSSAPQERRLSVRASIDAAAGV